MSVEMKVLAWPFAITLEKVMEEAILRKAVCYKTVLLDRCAFFGPILFRLLPLI